MIRPMLLAAALVAACCAAAPEPGPALPILRVTSGDSSAVLERGVRVARTQEELDALWAEHGANTVPAPAPPAVDFTTAMVVAVFAGQRSSGGHAITIEEVALVDRRLVVTVRETAPGPDDAVTMALTSPFDVVLSPLSAGEPEMRTRP